MNTIRTDNNKAMIAERIADERAERKRAQSEIQEITRLETRIDELREALSEPFGIGQQPNQYELDIHERRLAQLRSPFTDGRVPA